MTLDPDCVSVRIDNSAASANSLLCKIMLAVKSVLNCGGRGRVMKRVRERQRHTERGRERGERAEAFAFFRFIGELCANLLQCWIGAIILWQLSLNRKGPQVIVSKALQKAAVCVSMWVCVCVCVCVCSGQGKAGGCAHVAASWKWTSSGHTSHSPLPLVRIGHMHTHACTQTHAYMCHPHTPKHTHKHTHAHLSASRIPKAHLSVP